MRINKNVRKVVLFISLFLNLFCVAYGRSLKREQDGFKWFLTESGYSVCDKNGNTIVPADACWNFSVDKEGDYFVAHSKSLCRVYNQYGKMLASSSEYRFSIIGNKIISERVFDEILGIIDTEGKRIIPYKKYKNNR